MPGKICPKCNIAVYKYPKVVLCLWITTHCSSPSSHVYDKDTIENIRVILQPFRSIFVVKLHEISIFLRNVIILAHELFFVGTDISHSVF